MDSQTDDWVGARDGYYLSWVFNALKDLQGKGVQVKGQVWLNAGVLDQRLGSQEGGCHNDLGKAGEV